MPSCEICKKKIKKMFLSIYKCKCGRILCSKHKEHECTYDHSKDHKKLLENSMEKIVNQKLIKI